MRQRGYFSRVQSKPNRSLADVINNFNEFEASLWQHLSHQKFWEKIHVRSIRLVSDDRLVHNCKC